MKKLLSIILALAMVLSLAACSGQSAEEPTEAPSDVEYVSFVYEEDRGDFVVTWTLHLGTDGSYKLEELHGLSGETTVHTGKEWKDNGDGTLNTGAWDDPSADKSDFLNEDGSCTWVMSGDKCSPAGAAAALAGTYVYEENRGDFIVTWTVTLKPDGSFAIDELHGLSGQTVNHSGREWTDNGDGTITTGEWDNKEVDKSEFFAPNGVCTWTLGEDGTIAPVVEDNGEEEVNANAINPGKYTYVETKGPGDFTWEILLMGNGGCRIDETNPSGEVTEHETAGWVDNGDGTVTTGEWTNKEVDKSDFFAPTGECTWKINADGTCEPVAPAEEATAEVNPGKYTYIETKGPGDFTWEVLLMGNGNCRIDEISPSGEVTEHEAAGWTDNGDGTVTTGEWTNKEVDKSDFFAPTGECTWKINADGTCEPVTAAEEAAGNEVNPGKYTYVETKGPGDFTWEVLLMGNGNCRIDETLPSGEVVEHEAAGWTDNGDGTVTTGAWTDASAEKSDFFGEDGTCTWKINADGTCEPIA